MMIGWASLNFLAFFGTPLQKNAPVTTQKVWNHWVQFMRICLILGNFRQQKGVGISSKTSVIHPSATKNLQAKILWDLCWCLVYLYINSTIALFVSFCWYRHFEPQEISAKPGPNLVPPALDRIRLHGEGEWNLAFLENVGSEDGHWSNIYLRGNSKLKHFDVFCFGSYCKWNRPFDKWSKNYHWKSWWIWRRLP